MKKQILGVSLAIAALFSSDIAAAQTIITSPPVVSGSAGQLLESDGHGGATGITVAGDGTISGSTLTITTVNGVAVAPLNSPGLTGSPTSTTPPTADNSTRIATTAQVQAAITAAGGSVPRIFLAGTITADFNTTGDQPIVLTGPANNWMVYDLLISHCTGTITTAKGTLYSTINKGNSMFGSATSAFGITGTAGTAHQYVFGVGTLAGASGFASGNATVYWALTTVQGSATTCRIDVIGFNQY